MSKRDPRKQQEVDKCGRTRKRRFKSHAAAMQFYADLGDECRAAQMRAYHCQFCGGYHLTSQDRSYWRARDSR